MSMKTGLTELAKNALLASTSLITDKGLGDMDAGV